MADAALVVRWGGRDVGLLHDGADQRFTFTYAETWLADAAAPPISLSLPRRGEPYVGGAAHNFFANLLPEGAVRQAVCRRLGISEDNDLALLRAIGGECAGALSLVEPGRAPVDPDAYQYEVLDDRRLQAMATDDQVVPLLIGGGTTRLSLAGAQGKVPVALLDGELHLPLAGAPSTHILKLPHAQFAHIPANEAFVMGLGARLGLGVVATELMTRTTPPSLLVERYDRVRGDDPWPATRLHQEDLCQALGLPSARKYQQEGGPSLVDAVATVRAHVREPLVDVRRLLQWQAFNVVVGNSDGHGKNLSLVLDPGGPRLAPFYDLLSTRSYPRLDRNLAMGVGGRRDPDQLGRAQWVALASDLAIGARVVIAVVRDVADRVAAAMDGWTAEFRDRHGDAPVLQTLPREIAARARRVVRAMS